MLAILLPPPPRTASVLSCQPCPSFPFWPCYLPFLALLPTRPQHSMLFSTLPGTVQPTAQATMHLRLTHAFNAAAKALLAVLQQQLLLLACCYWHAAATAAATTARRRWGQDTLPNGTCIHAVSSHHRQHLPSHNNHTHFCPCPPPLPSTTGHSPPSPPGNRALALLQLK